VCRVSGRPVAWGDKTWPAELYNRDSESDGGSSGPRLGPGANLNHTPPGWNARPPPSQSSLRPGPARCVPSGQRLSRRPGPAAVTALLVVRTVMPVIIPEPLACHHDDSDAGPGTGPGPGRAADHRITARRVRHDHAPPAAADPAFVRLDHRDAAVTVRHGVIDWPPGPGRRAGPASETVSERLGLGVSRG
jgi:hypothetical protein